VRWLGAAAAPGRVAEGHQRAIEIDGPRQQRVPPRLGQRGGAAGMREERERQLAAGADSEHDEVGFDRGASVERDPRHAGVFLHGEHACAATQRDAAGQRRALEQAMQFVVPDAERGRKARASEPLRRQLVQVPAVLLRQRARLTVDRVHGYGSPKRTAGI